MTINYDKIKLDFESLYNTFYYKGEQIFFYIKEMFNPEKFSEASIVWLVKIWVLLWVVVFVFWLLKKWFWWSLYYFKRKSYLNRFSEIRKWLLKIKEEINSRDDIDQIDLKRINYMITDTLNLIEFYNWARVWVDQMQRDLDDMIRNFENLKEGKNFVLKNIEFILRKK